MKKILLTLALVAAAQFTFAQEKTDDAKQPASELMTQLRLASDLARYGYETYSASALIEAARILNGVPTYELTPESFIKGEGTADGKAQKTEFLGRATAERCPSVCRRQCHAACISRPSED